MRSPRIVMSAALALTCCSALSAQEPEKPRKPAKPDFTPGQLFERNDTNKDGYLSKDEAPERFKDRFERMDQNKDGKLSKEEVQRAFDRITKPMPPTPGGPRPGAGPDLLFRLLDANEDGKLSREELEKAPDLMRRHDRNRDGVLEPQELSPAAAPRKPEKPAKPFKPDGAPGADVILERLDGNKDGKVSKDEARGPLAENFERLDRNSDGQLDKQELQVVAERLRQAGQDKPLPNNPSRPGAAFDDLDKNADGRLTTDELKGSPLADKLADIDVNKDGKVDPKEYEAYLEKSRPKADK